MNSTIAKNLTIDVHDSITYLQIYSFLELYDVQIMSLPYIDGVKVWDFPQN